MVKTFSIDGGGGGVQMDEDTVKNQIELIRDSQETLTASLKTMVSLGEGQTATVWTDDGRSVDLMKELRARYDSAQKWLTSIQKDLDEAAVNLDKAIKETTQMDEDQKVRYQTLLYQAVGGPMRATLA
jgi:hypothetical protein